MDFGKLRHRVSLQRETITNDAASFTDIAVVWASVMTSGGREFYAAKRFNQELSHEVTIRYRPGVEPGMRIVHRDVILRIAAALDPDGSRRSLLLHCTQVVQPGTSP